MTHPSAPNPRFAVATKAGIAVDLHFGHARTFHVYEAQGQDVRLVEIRDADKYCTGQSMEDETREQILNRIVQTLHDVQVLMVARIGTAPREYLGQQGLAVSEEYAHSAIPEAILTWQSAAR